MLIRVGHLYPDYLNIYADRGNIAVLTRRALLRGHEVIVDAVSVGDPLEPGNHDLLYVGGGQDREQALIAPDLAARGDAIRRAVESHLEVEPHPFLRDGDRVRIKSGPLAGIEGILIRRKSAYRLILSAELLERSIAVEVDAFSVDPTSHRVASPPLSSTRTQPFVYYRAAG